MEDGERFEFSAQVSSSAGNRDAISNVKINVTIFHKAETRNAP